MAASNAGAAPERTATVTVEPEPVYPAEFYAAFQPQTALDMLERTPGFTLSEGSSVRGFGGAAGNVLIDGQRPTVKAGGIGEVLRRIPAARVERIVLLRGADTAEAQGQVLVANVVLRADATGSGNATLTLEHTADGIISPQATISYARAIGSWQTSIELSGEIARYPSDAVYRIADAGGALTATRIEEISGRSPELGLAASASRAAFGGTLTLNGRLNWDPYLIDQTIALFAGEASGAPDGYRTIDYDEDKSSGELGVDWTRALGKGWSAKLVGLGRVEAFTSDEDYTEPGYRGVSALEQKPLELVARGTITRGGSAAFRPELGAEIAYNRLTSTLDYAEDTGAGLVPVALSNADTRVSELRGEAFANLTLRLSSRLELETGAAFEMSRIRVTGDTASEESLSYLKPSAALVWSLSANTQLRLGARRTVDQLDFGDFAASVDQADGRPLGGNAQLRPARVTKASLRLDHRWGGGGALSLEGFHQWHEGMLGYFLLPSGDEALGTIGNARQWGLTAQGALPLDALLPRARLSAEGTVRGSHFRDPLTQEVRDMDDALPFKLSAEFRHDVPALRSSWGVTYKAAQQGEVFYSAEHLFWREAAVWGGYVETTALAGYKATLTFTAIGGEDDYRRRRFYRPSRIGAFTGSEQRDRTKGMRVSLSLSRQL
ncbi:TonB-dependent receptor plug domain-containing protein [Aurantiacibacter xanthus]|uniref:TonB-dependent receptor plug domain-containing protein n=1 Tax=Aurantiacibacter xanthus TaxID=1784712 RepID=UPI001FE5A970|nr:TonB-dependent receptor [Aurantiacibacter xanthus]